MKVRILSKGKITDLSSGFNLGNNPFSIYVRPKGDATQSDLIIGCKLICDKSYGEFPVRYNDWTPGKIVSISPNAIDLSKNDVYWGTDETLY